MRRLFCFACLILFVTGCKIKTEPPINKVISEDNGIMVLCVDGYKWVTVYGETRQMLAPGRSSAVSQDPPQPIKCD